MRTSSPSFAAAAESEPARVSASLVTADFARLPSQQSARGLPPINGVAASGYNGGTDASHPSKPLPAHPCASTRSDGSLCCC